MDYGKMIREKEKEYGIVIMEIDTKEIVKMTMLKEREYIIITMVKDMKVPGKMECAMEMELIISIIRIKQQVILAKIKPLEHIIEYVLMVKSKL